MNWFNYKEEKKMKTVFEFVDKASRFKPDYQPSEQVVFTNFLYDVALKNENFDLKDTNTNNMLLSVSVSYLNKQTYEN